MTLLFCMFDDKCSRAEVFVLERSSAGTGFSPFINLGMWRVNYIPSFGPHYGVGYGVYTEHELLQQGLTLEH
jgi:hypothetical protein